jgi:RNA polymerase sigma-70 factor (ECF subfamily)
VILLGACWTHRRKRKVEKVTQASESVTGLLLAWSDGDQAALEKLIPLVYAELHRLARRYMRRENAGHTLQTSALVNEAYLRLIEAHRVRWQNRSHFFAVSAQIMRRILVDFARAKQNLKRGGGALQVLLDEGLLVSPERGADLVALDEALERLGALNARQSQVVESRYFGGLNEEEVAEVLKVSPRTVRNDWSLARAWLYRELSSGGGNDA